MVIKLTKSYAHAKILENAWTWCVDILVGDGGRSFLWKAFFDQNPQTGQMNFSRMSRNGHFLVSKDNLSLFLESAQDRSEFEIQNQEFGIVPCC
jgi:hypothetical protein